MIADCKENKMDYEFLLLWTGPRSE